jgi:hypothetical protein
MAVFPASPFRRDRLNQNHTNMKKIILASLVLLWTLFVNAQLPAAGGSSMCLAPVCQPFKCITTDTVVLAFGLNTSDGFKGIAFTQKSGPSAAIIGAPVVSWSTGQAATSTAKVYGFVPGTYVFQAIGTSASGGISAPAIDSVVVSAPAIVIPPLKFIVTAIPLMDGKHFTIYSDGSYLLQ